MGKPGPKKGSATAKAAAARAVATRMANRAAQPSDEHHAGSPADADAPPAVEPVEEALASIPAAHRENPEKLTGQALKNLGHRRGLSKSAMASMSDERIRTELRYIAYSQYEEPVVA